jgi:hypothetical protein
LGGEELRLVRPKGRAGRRFIVRVQSTFDLIAPIYNDPLLKKKESEMTDDEQIELGSKMIKLSNTLFLDENLHFEDEILPGLYQFSELGLSPAEARKKLDTLDDTPQEIIGQFLIAFQYFISVNREDKEAVDEALEKSEAGAE